jgi:hypothetical protein
MDSLHSGLAWLIKWEILVLLGGFAGIILLRIFTGEIGTRYLLWGKRANGTRYFSPERVQLLLATVAIAAQYVIAAIRSNPGEMPQLPDGALQLLGLSNAIYLGGKGWNLFRSRQN